MFEPARILLNRDEVTVNDTSLRLAMTSEDVVTVTVSGSAATDAMGNVSVTSIDVAYNRSISVASVGGAVVAVRKRRFVAKVAG